MKQDKGDHQHLTVDRETKNVKVSMIGRSRLHVRWLRVALVVCALNALLNVRPASAQGYVADTVHNLSAGGPGGIRAASEPQVCIFCHAPHSTAGVRPLWNREIAVSNYQIYKSSTLDANTGQPTGSSKLCLSCHDGTIALGNILSRPNQIQMVGSDFVPPGSTNLGTDLSDDHPISFTYSSGLAAADRQLVTPGALPPEIRLDADGQLQCTSCHDPHRNTFGNFLVKDDTYGNLCTSCHAMNGWTASSHRNSDASVAGAMQAQWPHSTVAADACRSCHRPHTASGHARLLINTAEEENCLACHDGSVARTNMRAELDKPGGHDPRRYQGLHDPTESDTLGNNHVECSDCHNPHAIRPVSQTSGYTPIGSTMDYVSGVAAGGSQLLTASNEYEVCFRCHGDNNQSISSTVQRLAQQSNFRLKFSATNPSFHPVVTSSPSTDTISLIPSMAQGTLIRCTDCHNNDAGPRAGGVGPDGPHGSTFDYLLERNYSITDQTVESDNAYSLCYKCHRRASILSDESFSEHRKHIVEERAPCSACHDPHGVSTLQSVGSDHTHLINFDTQIVRPSMHGGRLEFRDLGRFAGSCTLTCHGEDHRNEDYGPGSGAAIQNIGGKRQIRQIRRVR